MHETLDANYVDLASGTIRTSIKSISIGNPAEGGVSFDRQINIPSIIDGNITSNGSTYTVTIDGRGEQFTLAGGIFTPVEANGSVLTLSGSVFTFGTSSGAVATFDALYGGGYVAITTGGPFPQPIAPPTTAAGITSYIDAAGYSRSYLYTTMDESPSQNAPIFRINRLQSVTTNAGYRVQFTYQDVPPAYVSGNYISFNGLPYWWQRVKVTLLNNRIDTCPVSSNACVVADRPTLTFAQIGSPTTNLNPNVADASGGLTTISSNGTMTTVQPPGAVPPLVYNLTSGKVSSAVVQGVTTAYSYVDAGGLRTTTRTTSAGTETYKFILTTMLLAEYTDALSNKTSYTYNASNRLTRITLPELNYVDFTPDARGNVILTRVVAKPGSGIADIVTSAVYPPTCTNPQTCNSPTSTTDAKGNVTDYTYDPMHGGVLTVTAPAATVNGVRPQTRYSYTALAGSAGNIYKLTGVSACATLAVCTGTSDEVKLTKTYGSWNVTNLQPQSETFSAGDGSLTATTTLTYNAIGAVDSIDGPLAGSADTSRTLYNLALRRIKGVVSPDPDGAGALKNRAQRFTYDTTGRVTLTEVGTVNIQSDADWATFTPLQAVETIYDANSRVSQRRLKIGNTIYALSQVSYDSIGRVDCASQRMAPVQWSSQTNACVPQTTGANGPDRVTRWSYDANSRVIKLQAAVGTADVSDEVVSTYSPNGAQKTVADANGNLTTYEYDGFDRLLKTRYPTADNGAISSTTDYDGVTGYDPNGNVTQRRLRDGQLINLTYDNLNRVTLKDVPNIVYGEQDIGYSYNLLGQLLAANNANGFRSVIRSYDALGRMVSEKAQLSGTFTMAYDLAGRLTRLTHPDGLFVDYDTLVTGEISAIREKGAASGVGVLGRYVYNDLGQMTMLTRGNGTTTTYSYDPVARLSQLTHDLGGTAQDVTTTFAYNPAFQIASTTRSNDAYAWNGHYNVNRPYAVNGLNQLTTAGATALGYDGRGNLTSSGTASYGYTSENRLVSGPSGAVLVYDALGRLATTALNGGATNQVTFDSVGGNIVIERGPNGTGLLRRYVYGPGTDAPLTWYEGAGTADRRWLIPDERGSIMAVTNATGTATAINSYDEYGIPASTNVGRFQYTGQAWLPEVGMSYYKARMYSPTLGRFMQTDPIGYGDGMNWYAYVGGDPVNFADPSGMGGGCEAYQGTARAGCEASVGNSKSPPDIIVMASAQ